MRPPVNDKWCFRGEGGGVRTGTELVVGRWNTKLEMQSGAIIINHWFYFFLPAGEGEVVAINSPAIYGAPK